MLLKFNFANISGLNQVSAILQVQVYELVFLFVLFFNLIHIDLFSIKNKIHLIEMGFFKHKIILDFWIFHNCAPF